MIDPMQYHIIKDPVHGTMQFSEMENNWIKPFVDSPNFQRLRHIKQLGLGDYIFPGALHTRFNHSLGCAYVAGQIASKIGLAEEERQLVMIACLLHDIGHGPFSHTFEDVFYKKIIRHEAWTPFFLANFRTKEFFAFYNQINPRHHLTDEKFKLIEDMIMHRASYKRVLSDIVSSQLDADRLDYLLRDNLFCGVSYGHYDFHWMLSSMVIVHSDGVERLGLTHKGIGVVEHYLMARRLMTRNIYFHHKKLAFEFFLVKLLSNLAESLEIDDTFRVIKETRLGHFLLRVNQFNQIVANSKNKELEKLRFLENNYLYYTELGDYDIFSVIKLLTDMDASHTVVQIAKRLHYRIMPKIIRLDHLDLVQIEKILSQFKKHHCEDIKDWQIALIKTPHQSYTVEEDPILIKNEHNIIKPLNEISLMIQAIGDKLEHTAFLSIDKVIFEKQTVQDLIKKIISV